MQKTLKLMLFAAAALPFAQTVHAQATAAQATATAQPAAKNALAPMDAETDDPTDAAQSRFLQNNEDQSLNTLLKRRGMTWIVRIQQGNSVQVGQHSASNAYKGDMPVTARLPMLCIKKLNLAVPSGITPDFYHGWSGGQVRLTPPIYGYTLVSPAVADAICAGFFGSGFKMAEFHDGNGGWSYWAQGNLSKYLRAKTKFWVAINDQPANPWNSVP
ncbi:hypothetical protein Dxin01_03191 [Deinococcus xinjiangensis]|uniref:Uncharacterized protein n=1 Tax=Deinococcus xinjiangensis TaxID=457454 RepID=A0ABP9VH84_9DEIO